MSSSTPLDLLAALGDLVRTAAREGVLEALTSRETTVPATPVPLIDKRGIAHAVNGHQELTRFGHEELTHPGVPGRVALTQ